MLPDSPKKWANHLSKMLSHYHTAHPDTNRFPINIIEIATEYSKSVFPNEPITLVEGACFSKAFEGALLPNPQKNGEWGIFYNQSIQSKGRINFTLAHELGHYLLHRYLLQDGRECSRNDMLNWQSQEMIIENEANLFASSFLMPSSDFNEQIYDIKISRDLILNLASRYGVSVTAAALKWLNLTKDRAMLILSNEGIIDWSRSNDKLFKTGIYYSAKKDVICLPIDSLAIKNDNNEVEKIHRPNTWPGNEEVREILIYKNDDYALQLLIYPLKSNLIDNIEDAEDILLEPLTF